MPYLEMLREVINRKLLREGVILSGKPGCKDIEIRGNIILFRSGDDIIRHNILGNLFNDIKGYKKMQIG